MKFVTVLAVPDDFVTVDEVDFVFDRAPYTVYFVSGVDGVTEQALAAGAMPTEWSLVPSVTVRAQP